MLLVDGQFLQPRDSGLLEEVLSAAYELIVAKTAGTEMTVAVIRLQPGTSKVARRVFRRSVIFGPDGEFIPGVDTSTLGSEELQPRFLAYWRTAEALRYIPNIRLVSGPDDWMNGACLYVRPQSPS